MTLGKYPALVCKNCSQPMPLPPATNPCTSQGLGSWPKDCAPRNFLCPTCKHVFVYSAQDVRGLPVEVAPRRANKMYNVVSIGLPCGAGNCASLLRIHTLMAFDADPLLEAPEVVAPSTAHDIQCGTGHTQSGPSQRMGMAYDAEFDPLWVVGE
jgi:hypothetical protein